MRRIIKHFIYHLFISKRLFILSTIIIIFAAYSICLSFNFIVTNSIMYKEFNSTLNCSVDNIYEIDMSQYSFSYPDEKIYSQINKFTYELFDLYKSRVGGVVLDEDKACYIDANLLQYICINDINNKKINRIDKRSVYLGYSSYGNYKIGDYIEIDGKDYRVQGFLKKNSYIILPNLTSFDKYYLDDYMFGEMEIEYDIQDDRMIVDHERTSNLFVISDTPDIEESIKEIADNNEVIVNSVITLKDKQRLYQQYNVLNQVRESTLSIVLFFVSIISVLVINYISIENSTYRFWVMLMNGFMRGDILMIILLEIVLKGVISVLAGSLFLKYSLKVEGDIYELKYYIIPLIVVEIVVVAFQYIFSYLFLEYKIRRVTNGGKN